MLDVESGHRPMHLAGDFPGLPDVSIVKNHGELLAAVTRQQVFWPADKIPQRLRHAP